MKKYILKKIYTRNITKFLKLLKTEIIERKFQNMLKEIFTSVLKYSVFHKERKKQTNQI